VGNLKKFVLNRVLVVGTNCVYSRSTNNFL